VLIFYLQKGVGLCVVYFGFYKCALLVLREARNMDENEMLGTVRPLSQNVLLV